MRKIAIHDIYLPHYLFIWFLCVWNKRVINDSKIVCFQDCPPIDRTVELELLYLEDFIELFLPSFFSGEGVIFN